ncbi:hypothetical protein FACS189452_03370 [Bacteroidia bacterium]|nr:hypothetical protein FACS189452_03370 [Bacteroidia bacterium]GHT80251.1 hypothetical protein FACS189467_1990 [Bacteroidia bacterium]
MKIKPFAAIRPPKDIAHEVAARPYDVLDSNEAKNEASEKSLLHITKPEIDFSPIADEHSDAVYKKAVDNYKLWKEKGWLVQDSEEYYYVYAQTMGIHTQYGLAVCCHCDDYLTGKIKKHELTRKDKEDDRMKHVLTQHANIEPVFLSYPAVPDINAIVSKVIATPPEYKFVAEDKVEHTLWVIKDAAVNQKITRIFADIPALYIADGHHRTAAAARVGEELRKKNPHHTGNEEYNYFLAVIFPDTQLKIMDYNRVVQDLNGWNALDFVEEVKKSFYVENKGALPYQPDELHNFGMYLKGTGLWYSISAKPHTYNNADPIESLDVTILSRCVLDKILNIKDLRTDKRIDFVGGIRGLGALKKQVDSGKMVAAFALYPVSMQQLINIADNGQIMPPKTTWFEPKLRSGLFIHEF